MTSGADVQAVRAAIRDAVFEEVFVYSGAAALAGVSSALDQVIAVITIIAWIVVVVSAITLLNTLMLSVLDRRREIGVLRTLGADRRFTFKAILAEAAGIGVVGGLLGLVIGVALQYPRHRRTDERAQHRRGVARQPRGDRDQSRSAGDVPPGHPAAGGAGSAARHRRGDQRPLTSNLQPISTPSPSLSAPIRAR